MSTGKRPGRWLLLVAAVLCCEPAMARTDGSSRLSSSGGTLGVIPIKYRNYKSTRLNMQHYSLAHPDFTRTGSFYLPPLPIPQSAHSQGYQHKRFPVMVAFHGSGGQGSDMTSTFRGLADQHGFAVVAPTSSNPMGWYVPSFPGDTITDDFAHVGRCISWFKQHKGVRMLASKITTAGFSAGGYLAAQYASYATLFKSAVILHSSVDPSQLYSRVFPIWMSTGTSDPVFPVSYVESIASDLRFDGYNVTFRKYTGAHGLGNQQELSAAVHWWLSGAH